MIDKPRVPGRTHQDYFGGFVLHRLKSSVVSTMFK